MRKTQLRPTRISLDKTPIDRIKIDTRIEDDVPEILLGLQALWKCKVTRDKLERLLEEHFRKLADPGIGREGMPPWNVLVVGTLQEGLNGDWRRLTDYANCHNVVRQFLGPGPFTISSHYRRTLIDNVSLVTPELLAQVNQLVVEAGHKIRGKKPGSELAARCDSFAVETDVHYPTDIFQLQDALRGPQSGSPPDCRRSTASRGGASIVISRSCRQAHSRRLLKFCGWPNAGVWSKRSAGMSA